MARYRKIDVRTWVDAKFQSLSPIQPCGQGLWFYLLTNPDTTSIPGLFRAGEASMAEALRWPLKAFREAFAEAFAKGMAKADWEARLVWVPKSINYNRPESPNVVRGWRPAWDELPECSLKAEAFHVLKDFTEGLGEGFGKAFVEGCSQPHVEGVTSSPGYPSPNQEQEQEQEQEQDKLLSASADQPAKLKTVNLQNLWNTEADPQLPRWRDTSASRARKAKAALKVHPDLEFWRVVIRRINASAFCRGLTERGTWRANPDWLLHEATPTKVLEGKYDDRGSREGNGKAHSASYFEERAPRPQITEEEHNALRARAEAEAAAELAGVLVSDSNMGKD